MKTFEEFTESLNNERFSMSPKDSTGNYKFKVGDKVLVTQHDYSERLGKIVSLTKSGMNHQVWNHYNVLYNDNGRISLEDEKDIKLK